MKTPGKKIALAILLTAAGYSVSTTASAQGGGSNQSPPSVCTSFDRVVTVSQERSASIPFSPIDISPTGVNHFQLINLDLYTTQELNQLDADSITFFNEQLGLNFGGVTTPIPLGGGLVGKGLFLPGGQIIAVMFPYLSGQNNELPVISDTKSGINKLFHIESGNLVLFVGTVANAAAVVPGGLQAGQRIQNQDNFFYGNLDLVKRKENGKIQKRENFKATSDQLGTSPLNSSGDREFYVTLNLKDEDNNVGYGHSMTITDKYKRDGVTLDPTVRLRNIYTFCS